MTKRVTDPWNLGFRMPEETAEEKFRSQPFACWRLFEHLSQEFEGSR